MSNKLILDLFNFIKLLIENDEELEIFFEKYSDIYVDEFLMFFSIKTYISEIIAPIEIYNILQDLIKDTYKFHKIKNIYYKYSNNYFTYNFNDYNMKLGQENLKKYMKEIFNHDMISHFITNVNLIINYYSNNISIKTYNIILVNEVLDIIKKKLNINNNIYVEQNNKILNSIKTLNYYNINNDTELYCYNLQKG